MRGLCLNWKVVAGLGVAGVGLWALAPEATGTALPILAMLACPLSMLFMMRSGNQEGGAPCDMGAGKGAPRETAEPTRAASAGKREERITQLKVELEQTRERQETIARRIAELEIEDSAAVREAQAVARSAERR